MTLDQERQLIAALQINPRVPWTRLGEVLAADPTTLARRWQHLRSTRRVWTSAFELTQSPTHSHVRAAHVEVTCAPGRREEVLRALADEPLVYGIVCTTGERDLVATVSGGSVLAVDRLVQTCVASHPGVVSTRIMHLPTIFANGPSWRLDALSSDQQTAIRATLSQRTPPPAPSALHRRLVAALNPDPRTSVAALAARSGLSPATVSRALEVVGTAEWARVRIDLAHEHLGWEAEVHLHLRVDSGSLPLVVATLRQFPDLRMCTSTSGAGNLGAVFWLRRLYELDTVEHRILTTHPSVTILDRWVVSRVVKRMGHVLDADGLHERHVPLEVPASDAAQ